MKPETLHSALSSEYVDFDPPGAVSVDFMDKFVAMAGDVLLLHDLLNQNLDPHEAFQINYRLAYFPSTDNHDFYLGRAIKCLDEAENKESLSYKRQRVRYLLGMMGSAAQGDNFFMSMNFIREIVAISPDLDLLNSEEIGHLLTGYYHVLRYFPQPEGNDSITNTFEQELVRDPSRIDYDRRCQILTKKGVLEGQDASYFEELINFSESLERTDHNKEVLYENLADLKREYLIASDKDVPEYERGKADLLASIDVSSDEERPYLKEDFIKVLAAEAKAKKDPVIFQEVLKLCEEEGLDFHAAEVAVEGLLTCDEGLVSDDESARNLVIEYWRVLEENLGTSLAIFFAQLDKFHKIKGSNRRIEDLLNEETEDGVVNDFYRSLPANIQNLARLFIKLFSSPEGDPIDFFNEASAKYWGSRSTKERVKYEERRCFLLKRSQLEDLGDKWKGASVESWMQTLQIGLIPNADDDHDFAVSFSDDTQIEFDEEGNYKSSSEGSILGMLAISKGSFLKPSFAFSGFRIESLSQDGAAALSERGIDIEQCTELGSLATFNISRQNVLKDLLLTVCQELVNKGGDQFAVMVTHKGAEMTGFRRTGLVRDEDYFVLDSDRKFRLPLDDYEGDYKESVFDFCENVYGFDRHLTEVIWSNYINNPRLPVAPYILDPVKVVKKFGDLH